MTIAINTPSVATRQFGASSRMTKPRRRPPSSGFVKRCSRPEASLAAPPRPDLFGLFCLAVPADPSLSHRAPDNWVAKSVATSARELVTIAVTITVSWALREAQSRDGITRVISECRRTRWYLGLHRAGASGRLRSRLGWVHRGRLLLAAGGDIKALHKTIVGMIYGAIVAWIALLIISQGSGVCVGNSMASNRSWSDGLLSRYRCLRRSALVRPSQCYGYAALVGYTLSTGKLDALTAVDNSNPLFLIVLSSILGAALGYLMGQLAGVLKPRPISARSTP